MGIGDTNGLWTCVLSKEKGTMKVDDTYYDILLSEMEHEHTHTCAWEGVSKPLVWVYSILIFLFSV